MQHAHVGSHISDLSCRKGGGVIRMDKSLEVTMPCSTKDATLPVASH